MCYEVEARACSIEGFFCSKNFSMNIKNKAMALSSQQVILQIANEILDGMDMPHDWMMSTVVPIYKKKGSVMDCASYRGVKLSEHGMKVVERLLEKRLRRLVKVNQMQFGFMPNRNTVDTIFILRRI